MYDGPDLTEIKYDKLSELLRGEDIPGNRLHICKLRLSAGRYILLASWHGPYKMTTQMKQKMLKRLLKVLHQLKEELGCEAFFIGGDFNLRYSLADQVIGDEIMIGPSVIGNRETVDCMIGYPSSNITVSMERGEKYDEFNHPVVYITIEINQKDSFLSKLRSSF